MIIMYIMPMAMLPTHIIYRTAKLSNLNDFGPVLCKIHILCLSNKMKNYKGVLTIHENLKASIIIAGFSL